MGKIEGCTRPVSEKFYCYIHGRVRDSFTDIGVDGDAVEIMMSVIDRYMETGEEPPKEKELMFVRLLFTLLRPEIDKAMARSKKARERAAVRKLAKTAVGNNYVGTFVNKNEKVSGGFSPGHALYNDSVINHVSVYYASKKTFTDRSRPQGHVCGIARDDRDRVR